MVQLFSKYMHGMLANEFLAKSCGFSMNDACGTLFFDRIATFFFVHKLSASAVNLQLNPYLLHWQAPWSFERSPMWLRDRKKVVPDKWRNSKRL